MNSEKPDSFIFNQVASFALLLFFWWILHLISSEGVSSIPSPLQTLFSLIELFRFEALGIDLQGTMLRLLAGYSLAAVIGVVIGLAIGVNKKIYDFFVPSIDFLRSIPVTTLYPLFILYFGIGNISKIMMVFFASVFVVCLYTAFGAWQIHKSKYDLIKISKASGFQALKLVVVPGSLSHIFMGLRIALSYSLIVIVVCEMFMGTQYGIGQRIFEAYTSYSIADLYGIVLLVGLLGYLLNLGLAQLEKIFGS